MLEYFEIAVNLPQVSDVFHYHAPPDLNGQVRPGQLVSVPFGKQRVQGVVIRVVHNPSVEETRPIEAVFDVGLVLTQAQIQFAHQLAGSTLAPLAACIWLMVPGGLGQQADTRFTRGEITGNEARSELQKRLINTLEKRGPLRGRQLDRAFPRTDWRRAMLPLVKRRGVFTEPILPEPKVKAKEVRTARLGVKPEAAGELLESLGRTEATRTRRKLILDTLIREAGAVEVTWLYAASGGSMSDLQYLAKLDLIILGETEVWRDPLEGLEIIPDLAPRLTPEQLEAWEQIRIAIHADEHPGQEQPRPILVHGVTGSGKTELYLRAVADTLLRGKTAIILVPEIALTPQTVRRFMARFPGQVGLTHSRLSTGERYDTWRRARDGQLPIIVGPRSALFAPLPNLGLIVVDESHDSSYYQTELPPIYHARAAAVGYARLAGAVCVMGSATPDVTSRWQAVKGRWQLLQLPRRVVAHREAVGAHFKRLEQLSGVAADPKAIARYDAVGTDTLTAELPQVRVVDMRQELKAGNRSIFSRALQEQIGLTLEQNQQAILFLNRRGSATYVFCRDCGHTLRCPRCDEVALTYHQDVHKLQCHHCGYSRNQPKVCPNCKSDRIRYYGTGTERVQNEVEALFPGARSLRWDWGTTRKKGSHEVILHHFANHQADILIGTQMLAKGLDLPLVTLVGIVLADVGLHLPDYRAGERAFQVLSQVAGRAGRSVLGGQVVLQSFDPDHYVIEAASEHNYAGFYERELGYREALGYPPFGQVVRLIYKHRDESVAQQAAETLSGQLAGWIEQAARRQIEVIGPAPCFYTRLDGYYRWQIILRGREPEVVLKNRQLGAWKVEVNPQSLL
jgi:primosomal protein N' (replication factor Y)